MKYIAILLISLLPLSNTSYAQDTLPDKTTYLTPYVGFLPFDYATLSGINAHGLKNFAGLPLAFGVRTEFNRKKKVSFKIDLNFSYTGFNYQSIDQIPYANEDGSYGYATHDAKLRSLLIKGLFAFNYYLKDEEKTQTYFSVGIGYKYKRRIRTIDNSKKKLITYSFNQTPLGIILTNTAFRIAWGKKIMVTDRFAFSFEVGLGGGGSPIQFGTQFKL